MTYAWSLWFGLEDLYQQKKGLSGQEAGLDRSLEFFEKDEIEWKDHENFDIYKKLFQLKKRNRALCNVKYGGEMIRVVNSAPDRVVSFYRESDGG